MVEAVQALHGGLEQVVRGAPVPIGHEADSAGVVMIAIEERRERHGGHAEARGLGPLLCGGSHRLYRTPWTHGKSYQGG